VFPYNKADCATTCLFAVVGPDGRLHVAQLGDGLALLVSEDSVVQVGRERDGFTNETTGLGVARHLSEWDTLETDASQITSVLLASDGIADDLDGSTLWGFADFVLHTYTELPPTERWRRLSADLRAWPTPYHSDDKTLALMWRNNKEGATQ